MTKVKILRVQEHFWKSLAPFCLAVCPEVRTLNLPLKCGQFSFTDKPGSEIHMPLHPLVLGFLTGDTKSDASPLSTETCH